MTRRAPHTQRDPQAAPLPARPRKRRRVAALVAVLVLLGIVAGIAGVAWYSAFRVEHDIAAGAPVEIDIPAGSSTTAIGETLTAAGVVPNSLMFRIKTRLSESDGQLKAGVYAMTTGMTYEDAIAQLEAGPVIVFFDVPIPEGFTARQIAARFAAETGVAQDELLALVTSGAPSLAADYPFLEGAYRDSLEGYLFPATYRVREGQTADDIVRMMLDKFADETDALDWSYAKSKNLTFSEVVIIASVLEREAKLEKEFPLVASVIYNRLGKPMRLQLCATVLYTMPEGTDKLTNEDTKRESPYNTYIHDGLPPGPISNPGIKALTAAAHPPKTDYLYYVLTGSDGSQTFCASYDEFLRAKQGAKQ